MAKTDDADENIGPQNLIEDLRNEIIELEDEPDAGEDVALPDHILTLIRGADVPIRIAAATDEIVAAVDPVGDAYARRVRANLATAMAERGTSIRFLEQATAHERQRRGLSQARVATQLQCDADVVAQVESGQRAFNQALSAEQVSDWILFLGLDIDQAVEALRQSLNSPADSYGGDMQERTKNDSSFVEEVARLLRSRSGGNSSDSSG